MEIVTSGVEYVTSGVPAGTLITVGTDFGDIQKPIEKIKPGDLLKTYDMDDYDGGHHELNTPTYTKIRKVGKSYATKLVKIKYSNGNSLITTIGHPLRMQAMPCGVVWQEDGSQTRGCSGVDEGMEEYDKVGARAKMITDIDDVDDWAKELGYHFCCNVGMESYSPEKKYIETKYDIEDLRFSNVITRNVWDMSQVQIGGFPILDGGSVANDVREDVDGNYIELVEKLVTIEGFEDIDAEFETYYIEETDLTYNNDEVSQHGIGENLYFANNMLLSTATSEYKEQEHH